MTVYLKLVFTEKHMHFRDTRHYPKESIPGVGFVKMARALRRAHLWPGAYTSTIININWLALQVGAYVNVSPVGIVSLYYRVAVHFLSVMAAVIKFYCKG